MTKERALESGKIVHSEKNWKLVVDQKTGETAIGGVLQREWAEAPLSTSDAQRIFDRGVDVGILQGMRLALGTLPHPGDPAPISAEQYRTAIQKLEPKRTDDGSYEFELPEGGIPIAEGETK